MTKDNMPVQLHFLGWKQPVIPAICDFILADKSTSPVNLENQIIIVPTRQAGRRLRETLVVKCEEKGTTLFPPMTVQPSFFLKTDKYPATASQTAVCAAWAEVLTALDVLQFKAFFPAGQPSRGDFSWAVKTGEMIQSLRNELADGGITVQKIANKDICSLEEPERWQDLAALEKLYLDKLAQWRLTDPCINKISVAEAPELPCNINSITLAATPDPSGLAVKALENIARTIPVQVLVHAPESYVAYFDTWGRPLPDAWRHESVPIPDEDRNLLLCGSAQDQAEKTIQIIRERKPQTAEELCVGVPDPGLIPFLDIAFDNQGISVFDPADRQLVEHSLWRLIDSLFEIVTDDSYNALATYLRHPYVLGHISLVTETNPKKLLTELDLFQNEYLPMTSGIAIDLLSRKAKGQEKYDALIKVLKSVSEQLRKFEKLHPEDALRESLREILKGYVPEDFSSQKEFINAASAVDDVLHEFSMERQRTASFTKGDKYLEILRGRIRKQTYRKDRSNERVDLEGWLELIFNPARLLIVTGMNEGYVPDTRVDDVFLPDDFRRQLNLRSDHTRLARDAFLMRSMIESRKDYGETVFIVGKTSVRGDPLKPSRLLFRCEDKHLVRRAKKMFAGTTSSKLSATSSISFKLNPNTCNAETAPVTRKILHITAFRDYLMCPFRFYLKHVLGMAHLDDNKAGPDALDFGILVHGALESMTSVPDYRDCDDARELADYLEKQANSMVADRYGRTVPLPVTISLAAATQRLAAAAETQAQLVREGWRVIQCEQSYSVELAGFTVKGKIDRIDMHESGKIRIIDYKTMDNPHSPEARHLRQPKEDTPEYARFYAGKKEKQWIDLQLPLYAWLYQENTDCGQCPEPVYFCLPKAITETGIKEWSNFDFSTVAAATLCAEKVLNLIGNNLFWPPADISEANDDFAELFCGRQKECFEIIEAKNDPKGAAL